MCGSRKYHTFPLSSMEEEEPHWQNWVAVILKTARPRFKQTPLTKETACVTLE